MCRKSLSAEEWLEALEDVMSGLKPRERPHFMKHLLQGMLAHYETLLPTTGTGAEKERIEMEMREVRETIFALKRTLSEDD